MKMQQGKLELYLVHEPTLVTELALMDHFHNKFNTALVNQAPTLELRQPHYLDVYWPVDYEPSLLMELQTFLNEWVMALLIDPLSKQKKSLYPVEFCAHVLLWDGTAQRSYYMSPVATLAKSIGARHGWEASFVLKKIES